MEPDTQSQTEQLAHDGGRGASQVLTVLPEFPDP